MRELDAEIAEKMFNNTELDYPHYSDNMVDAWLVVEEMRKNRWFLWLKETPEYDIWYARFWRYLDRGGETYQARQIGKKAAPEAICRAALKAIEQD